MPAAILEPMINQADILPVESPAAPGRAYDLLRRRVEGKLAETRGSPAAAARPTTVRVSVSMDAVDPFMWLRAQDTEIKMLWAARGEHSVTAMCGAADVVEHISLDGSPALDQAFPLLKGNDARYIGGMRFDADRTTDEIWKPFGAFRFVLPRFELESGDNETRLTCTLVLPRDGHDAARVLDAIRSLRHPDGSHSAMLPHPILRNDTPQREHWLPRVQQALTAFRETSLEKVVLARRAIFEFAEAPDPFLLLRTLRAATPDCFHFCFQPQNGKAFVGASPERLFKMKDGRLETEAVAGTRPRGKTAAADAQLREELLTSEKDRREHDFVTMQIQEALKQLCDMVSLNGSTSEMKLTRGRHLYAGLKGILRSGVSPLDVLRSLHPTPAVGGTPTDEARATIRRWESFDRGWYAGPFGWLSGESAEFAVAIRSGLLTQRRLALFSGAGIVEGSQPLAEWEEIEHKICDFIDVLGLFDNGRDLASKA